MTLLYSIVAKYFNFLTYQRLACWLQTKRWNTWSIYSEWEAVGTRPSSQQFYNIFWCSEVWTEPHLLPEHVEQWASKSDPRTRTTDLREPSASFVLQSRFSRPPSCTRDTADWKPKNGMYCFDTDARLPTTEPGQKTAQKERGLIAINLTVLQICCAYQIFEWRYC